MWWKCLILFILVVKRGVSGEWNRERSASAPKSFLRVISSKIASNLGIGIIGLMSFAYEEKYPLYFYLISAGFAFIGHIFSLSLIKKLSVNARLTSVVGVSAMSGSFFTYLTIFSIFSALLIMSGLSISYSIERTFFLAEELAWSRLSTFFIFGIIFYAVIRFIVQRKSLYFWSKFMMGLSLLLISIIRMWVDYKLIEIFKSKSIPMQFNLESLKEFLRIQAIVFGVLFSDNICNESILISSKKDSKKSDSAEFVSLIISHSITFLIFCVFIFTNSASINQGENRATKFLWILIIIASFIQSFEFFDCAHNLIYGFFKPIFQESIKTMENGKVREIWLTLLVLAVAYFVENPKEIFSTMIYSSSLILSSNFLVFPAVCLIQQIRKHTVDVEVILITSGLVSGVMGMVLFTSIIFGFHSLSDIFIGKRMFEYILQFVIAIIISGFIYFSLILLDIICYPPKAPSPISHRTLTDLEPFEYKECYITEIIIGIFMILTICCRPNILFTENIFLEVIYTIPLTFIHLDPIHLLLNSALFYFSGKRISTKIGPFHLLGFIVVSNMFSSIFAKILELHLRSKFYYSIVGSTEAILAIMEYFGDIEILIFSIRTTGIEYLLYCLSLSIFLLLTVPADTRISFSGITSGILFGIISWRLSIKAWKFKDVIHKTMTRYYK